MIENSISDLEKEILKKAKLIRTRQTIARKDIIREKIKLSTTIPTPLANLDHRYSLIYCDPPWSLDRIGFQDRSPENHYDTMSFEEICALPLDDITTESAVLFLWTTNALLGKALKVIEAWNFEYVSNLAWVKDRVGLGYYTRGQHELLLMARKGVILTPEPGDRPPSIVIAPRSQHSTKPVEFYELVERMYPTLDKLEMFARNTRPGWHSWGNQV
jgi:N6-adenosine-specific RNA methylase IME4